MSQAHLQALYQTKIKRRKEKKKNFRSKKYFFPDLSISCDANSVHQFQLSYYKNAYKKQRPLCFVRFRHKCRVRVNFVFLRKSCLSYNFYLPAVTRFLQPVLLKYEPIDYTRRPLKIKMPLQRILDHCKVSREFTDGVNNNIVKAYITYLYFV